LPLLLPPPPRLRLRCRFIFLKSLMFSSGSGLRHDVSSSAKAMALIGSAVIHRAILFESSSNPVPAPAHPRLGDIRVRRMERTQSGDLGGDASGLASRGPISKGFFIG